MLSKKITVCIFAFNEEIRILRCIRNFKDYAKIVVIDNYSTDATKEIVENAGIRCISIKNPNFIETPEVMNPVVDIVDTDYILIASVSEYVPLALLQKYAEVANASNYDVVRAYRVSITAGHSIPIAGVARKGGHGELRFFRKDAVEFTGNQVHGRGKILSAPNRVLSVVVDPALHFYQFRDYDCSHTELAHCRYDDVLAKQRYDTGQRFSWARALYHTSKSFLTSYVRAGSFRHGMLGFMHCYYRGHMEFTVWLRIWEWEHGYARTDVIMRNNRVRQFMELELNPRQGEIVESPKDPAAN
jgi:glycosyltransferase involved in cell wall biosynthesis